jgi:tetratricopeptide (TPR) repeat protein
MQIAVSLETKNQRIFIDSITIEKAKFIIRKLKDAGEKTIVFVDNFVDSVDAILELISNGVQVIGTDRTYVYDSISFRFSPKQLKVINITDITNADIQNIYDTIPTDIRKNKMPVSHKDGEGIYVFDIIESNVSLPRLRERFKSVLQDIGKKDGNLLNILVMMSYVYECRTPITYDLIYIFLDKKQKSYSDVTYLIEKLHELVVEYDGDIIDKDQYFFLPRSSAVASAVVEVCPELIFREVFSRFHEVISPMVIPRYDIFRRYAYDAKYALKAFKNWKDGKAYYEKLVRRTDNPYDWQYGSLYLAQKREYAEAFRWIDVAISKSGSRIFSIRNCHAKILFDANIPFARSSGDDVRPNLDRSMDTLKSCYDNDRRKAYHAMRFSDQAMQYHDVYNDVKSRKYLELASTWLAEQEVASSWNIQISRLLRDVKRKLIA